MSRLLTVSPGESLQGTIEGAAEGAAIHLTAGRWEENLRIERSLTLRGAGRGKTLIEGREEGYPPVWISAARKVTVRIEGLGIAGACGGCSDWPRGTCADGLLVQGPAEVKIINLVVSGNRRSGLFLRDEARVEVINSIIKGNGHYGLWLWDSTRTRIEGSIIAANGLGSADGLDSARDGIAVRDSAQAEITSSTISKNGDHGLWVSDLARTKISNSIISGNRRGGIWLRDGAQVGISGNRIIDNNGYGIALFQRPCYLTGHAFSGRIWGKGNIISGWRDPERNGQHPIAICPAELAFLMTEEGGKYP